ncbi:MAG: Sua5/YciO/YrdC/YwlC family protein [Nocardioides sp.]
MTTVSRARPAGPVVRRRLVVRGVVQGVGFRPHVALLAEDLGLTGGCHNDATSVEVEVEGPAEAVAAFERRVVADAPPLARVESVAGIDVPPAGDLAFVIQHSTAGAGERTMVPPDTAPCAACLRELVDPADRRYRHPFITCTHCGPRLTITLDLPYDRAQTTMAGFPLCPACAAEYADPRDRRYHAQPVACHDCGPSLEAGHPRLRASDHPPVTGTEPVLAAAIGALLAGQIVAVKGLGGYHLACDAANGDAVAKLRARKHRPDQPFAVMARDLSTAERLVEVGAATELLTSPERPIVLLPARPDAPVAGEVAPGLDELGVLLPYTPLHHLLFADRPDGSPGAPPVLVMTTRGTPPGEPPMLDRGGSLRAAGRDRRPLRQPRPRDRRPGGLRARLVGSWRCPYDDRGGMRRCRWSWFRDRASRCSTQRRRSRLQPAGTGEVSVVLAAGAE